MTTPLKLLFLSSALGPLGSGQGGGVEFKLGNLGREMIRRGHTVTVAAPAGSHLPGVPLAQVEGAYQANAYALGRQSPILMPPNPAQANIITHAYHHQAHYDLIVNFAYEWLPLYLTPHFTTPLIHFLSLPSLLDFMDHILAQIAARYPHALAVNTQAQADTYPFSHRCRIVGSGLDLAHYQFQPHPRPWLAWVGRITPEIGIEDALAAAQQTNLRLKIFGTIQDKAYWQQAQQAYPHAPADYMGFLPTDELQQQLGQCQALLMTHRWVEAFGNVAIEALACGVPVISYRRGGPTEIIRPGQTGWLVEPDSIPGLVQAINRLDQLDRRACRQQAEQQYTLEQQGRRYENWFRDAIAAHQAQP